MRGGARFWPPCLLGGPGACARCVERVGPRTLLLSDDSDCGSVEPASGSIGRGFLGLLLLLILRPAFLLGGGDARPGFRAQLALDARGAAGPAARSRARPGRFRGGLLGPRQKFARVLEFGDLAVDCREQFFVVPGHGLQGTAAAMTP